MREFFAIWIATIGIPFTFVHAAPDGQPNCCISLAAECISTCWQGDCATWFFQQIFTQIHTTWDGTLILVCKGHTSHNIHNILLLYRFIFTLLCIFFWQASPYFLDKSLHYWTPTNYLMYYFCSLAIQYSGVSCTTFLLFGSTVFISCTRISIEPNTWHWRGIGTTLNTNSPLLQTSASWVCPCS